MRKIFRLANGKYHLGRDGTQRIFELDDGSLFETSNNTAVRWYCDSCDCVIIYDVTDAILKVQRKCKLHKTILDKNMITAILAHRTSKNLIDLSNHTKSDKVVLSLNRQAEKIRIGELP